MNLEKALGFFSAPPGLSQLLSDYGNNDMLKKTDVLAAVGLVQRHSSLGMAAFFSKTNGSPQDKKKAIILLARHGLEYCDTVPSLARLDPDNKKKVILCLAACACAGYAHSAATTRKCVKCAGRGLTDLQICLLCKGKGVITAACRDCKGRGECVDRFESASRGHPVLITCKRCKGRGYPRYPSTTAYQALTQITDAISLDTWKKSVKPFYDGLISKLEMEQAHAEAVFKRVIS